MAAKMTADPDTRIITITEAPVSGEQTLNVQDDIYEPLKDDWLATDSLQKLKFPFRTFGDSKSATAQIGPYVFFNNLDGWRFLPFDVDHTLTLGGNLIPESSVQGQSVPTFLPRTGRTIIVPFETSAQALSLGGSAVSATTILEGSITWEQALRIMFSALASKVSGVTTTTERFRDAADSKDRIVTTLDANGNRTNVVVDGT